MIPPRECARHRICKTMIPQCWPNGDEKSEADYAKQVYCGTECGARGREEARTNKPNLNKNPTKKPKLERYKPNVDLVNRWGMGFNG